jgi:hypothetical protein
MADPIKVISQYHSEEYFGRLPNTNSDKNLLPKKKKKIRQKSAKLEEDAC